MTKSRYVYMSVEIYIIKIGRFVCGQLCDWSARSAGLACALRVGQYAPRCARASQAENERSEFSACTFQNSWFVMSS